MPKTSRAVALALSAWAPALLFALLFAAEARAQKPPPSTLRATDFSPYEQEAIDDALKQLHLVRDESPERKRLVGIDIVTLEVFEERDPLPRFLNIFHATTRKWVVEREMLVRAGTPYTQVLVDESVRNLRKLPALSVVLAVPVHAQGEDPSSVRLLVITKDVWSLRLSWDIAASNGGLEELVLAPSEINVFGTHDRASLLFDLLPLSTTFGAGYLVPRVAGTRVQALVNAQLLVNRGSGKVEGSYGALRAFQPLYTALAEWGWSSNVAWNDAILRRYVNAREASYVANGVSVPWEYRERTYSAQNSVTRSFGWETKHDVSLGASFSVAHYRPGDDALLHQSPSAVAAFMAKEAPRDDTRAGPFLQYHGYTTRFIRVLDFETLGLQEDYRLGHDVYARVYPLPEVLGGARDRLGLYAAAQYTIAIRDGLATANVESTTEAATDRLTDASLGATLHIVSPRFGYGRLVFDAHVLSRYRNDLNARSYLGGDGRLRGYPTSFLVGKDVVDYNLEYRTRAIEILTCELGGALFYDVGDAFDGFENLRPKQAMGAGIRALIPWLDRLVFRADIGVPIGWGARLAGVTPVAFFIAFEQAFPMPALTAAQLASGP